MINTQTPVYKEFLKLGFSPKEASVYLALLELGKRTVSPIARSAGINRTTAYDILDGLSGKGLIRVSGKEPLQEYVAESPDKVLNLLKNQLDKAQEKISDAEKLIPQLKSLHNVSERPKVKFYEGKEGLVEVYEDTLKSKEPILAFANVDDLNNFLPEYFEGYYKRRAKKGIHIKAIFPANKGAKERIKLNQQEFRESVLIPAEKYPLSPEINIYENKVMIASWREKLGVVIESQEIAEAMKTIFKLSWSEAKRLDKEL